LFRNSGREVFVKNIDKGELAKPTKINRQFGNCEPAKVSKILRSRTDADDVTFGAILPFSQVARVCDVKSKTLGNIA